MVFLGPTGMQEEPPYRQTHTNSIIFKQNGMYNQTKKANNDKIGDRGYSR